MAAMVNERELVLETLLLITRDGEYSHIALKNVLDKYQYLEKRERAFITRVVEGTLERQIELDYIINQFSKVKVNKMKPVIRTILRSSVYQLKYMDNVPNSAVCNEAVKLAVKKGFVNLKGFVNGVLRTIDRNLEQISYPDRTDLVAFTSVRYSLPEWMVRKWLNTYEADTVIQIAEAFLKERPLTVRRNTARVTAEEFEQALDRDKITYKRHPELSYAYELSGYDYLAGLDSFRKGLFYVQDVSSMQVAEWADPKQGDYVIDVCAAPGGKAIHMAEKLQETGHVEARDLTEYKVNLIEENILRSGLTNIDARCQDALIDDQKSHEKADIVVADLPCSGLGVLGKKPDLKSKMTEQMQADLAKLQRNILSVVHQYVKKGGTLIYSTCTINREENEENTAWFLKNHPEFQLIKEKQILPGKNYGDGFYIACLKKVC